jgi:ElaB/YqjD/DUF883 family membrane-anchored ribosome-binding protein
MPTTRFRNSDVKSRVNGLRADLDKLRKDAVGLAGEMNGSASEGYRSAMQAAQSLAERSFEVAEEATSRFGRTASRIAEETQDWSLQSANFMRNTVREQPLQSLLITLGLGAVIGAFFSRR